jgi:L,D-transpeptidase ErfK/SrfK
MNPDFRSIRRLGVLLTCAALASCSLTGGPWANRNKTGDAPPAPAVPELPLPVPTHHFLLEPGQDIVGVVQMTTSTKEDTLSDIARRFNVGYEEIVRANPGVDPWLPGEGKSIIVPTRFILPNVKREGIIINMPQMRLFYFPPVKKGEPQTVYTHPVGIGRVGWVTPQGSTKVTRRQKDPTWRPTASILKEHRENGDPLPPVVGPGPDNPLGRHAMYLGWPSYLIHGTNKPAGVGLRSSHGCIRLYPEDIALLFDNVTVGTKVTVVNEPFVFGWAGDDLYIQAFDVLEDDPRDWKKAEKKLLTKTLGTAIQKELKKRSLEVSWEQVSTFAHQPRGLPIAITRADSSVEGLLAAAPTVQNRVPDGASWDGKSDLPVDEETFNEMLSDRDPQAPAVGAPASTLTPAVPAKTGT